MKLSKLELILTSYPDESALVAELWCESGMFAAIRYQGDSPDYWFELFPLADRDCPRINLTELEGIITQAKRRLREIEGRQPKCTTDGPIIPTGG